MDKLKKNFNLILLSAVAIELAGIIIIGIIV